MKGTQYLIHQHIIYVKGEEDKYMGIQSNAFFHCHSIAPFRQKEEPACCVHLARSERDV
jgi:hypothetical protein